MVSVLFVFRRFLLFCVHFLILTVHYVRFVYEKCVKIVLGEKQITEKTFSKFKKIPSHLALVFNTKHPQKYSANIQEVIDLAQNIKGVNEITLFFTENPPELTYERERFNVFTDSDIPKLFLKEMEENKSLSSSTEPFKSNVDFIIFYSKIHSLCNFFPWKLDVTMFSYPGKINICSKYSLYKSFVEYQNTEQRLGK